jgi:hypothetical protein
MMRALSSNMTEHNLFLSTPKFISDLLFVSEVLKGIPMPERNDYLKSVLAEINKHLPSNVYIPISQDKRMHRVLRISEQNAFCLHSKERVPYHIIIEVAYDPDVLG